LHLITTGLNGFLNSCAYATSPGTWELFKKKVAHLTKKICWFCRKKQDYSSDSIEEEEKKISFLSTNFAY
jgi:hypothetical protein